MILYHGTYMKFDRIDLSKSNKGKDFGKGFYLSDSYDQALKLATFKSIQYKTDPVVISYEFDYNVLFDGNLNFRYNKLSFSVRMPFLAFCVGVQGQHTALGDKTG